MRQKSIDSEEVGVGQAIKSEVLVNDDGGQTFKEQFETIDTPNYDSILKAEKFANELVEVEISETDNPNAEQLIQLGVNGNNQFLWRGVPQKVKRCFVEVLARAKVTSYQTPEFTDPNGNRATSIKPYRGLRYPFRVLHDPNPDGPRWLQSILHEQ